MTSTFVGERKWDLDGRCTQRESSRGERRNLLGSYSQMIDNSCFANSMAKIPLKKTPKLQVSPPRPSLPIEYLKSMSLDTRSRLVTWLRRQKKKRQLQIE